MDVSLSQMSVLRMLRFPIRCKAMRQVLMPERAGDLTDTHSYDCWNGKQCGFPFLKHCFNKLKEHSSSSINIRNHI